MLLEEYNETATMELFREEGRAEGRAEGREEGRAEGRVEGEILQAIKMYRKLAHYSDEQILDTLRTEFGLSKEVAEPYLVKASYLY